MFAVAINDDEAIALPGLCECAAGQAPNDP